jgi:hypothetical protein
LVGGVFGGGLGGVVGGGGSPTRHKGRARRRGQVHAARGLRRVWAWIWAWIWAQRGVGVFGGVFGGGLGGVVGVRGATWWWSSCPRLHVRTASKKPRRATKSKLHAELTGSCARAPNSRTHPATRRFERRNLGLQNGNERNSKSRRLAPDNSNPLRFLRVTTCGLASQPTCPDRASRTQRAARCAMEKSPKQETWLRTTKRQEEDDKHKTKPEISASEVRCCYLTFASIEDMYGPNGAPFCTSYLGDTADLISRNGAGTLNHARTYDTTCPGVRITPIRCRLSLVASLVGCREYVCGCE